MVVDLEAAMMVSTNPELPKAMQDSNEEILEKVRHRNSKNSNDNSSSGPGTFLPG